MSSHFFSTLAATAIGGPAAAEAPRAGGWLTTFHPFGIMHLITAGTLALCMITAALLGRLWRRKPETAPRERTLRSAIIWSTILFQAWGFIYYFLPANFNPKESLPLHICDVAAWIAPLALLTQNRLLRITLYYWGIGLSTQAFFTPVVDEGPAHWKFWLFWIGHAQIIGIAIYDCAVLGFRPTWRTCITAIGITMLYVLALLLPINLAMGWNYAYVGNTLPEKPTILDKLGDWPLRVVYMVFIVSSVFAVATIAWPISRRIGRAVGLAPSHQNQP
jgi:hypothetical integral membrane protein (TIGR02206 family)